MTKVPSLRSSGSLPGSVTVYDMVPLLMLPVILPENPTEQVASCRGFLLRLELDFQHQSMTLPSTPAIPGANKRVIRTLNTAEYEARSHEAMVLRDSGDFSEVERAQYKNKSYCIR